MSRNPLTSEMLNCASNTLKITIKYGDFVVVFPVTMSAEYEAVLSSNPIQFNAKFELLMKDGTNRNSSCVIKTAHKIHDSWKKAIQSKLELYSLRKAENSAALLSQKSTFHQGLLDKFY